MMLRIRLVLTVVLVLGISACSRMESSRVLSYGETGAPSRSTTPVLSSTDLGDFIDQAVFVQLSDRDRSEAASAQFYALQYGRPGAPRVWQADSGAVGKVLVGPYVRVNNLDCREFTHEVVLDSVTAERNGTACREPDGAWNVVDS